MSIWGTDKLREELSRQKVVSTGDRIPSATVIMKGVDVDLSAFFRNRTGIIFGVPGAFTKVCTEKHLPGFREKADELKEMVDMIACLAVNDPYVLKAWASSLQISDQFVLLSDYNGDLSRRLGVLAHFDQERLGIRCRRFAMICGDGEVQWIGFDEEAFVENVMDALRARPQLLKSNRAVVQATGLAVMNPKEDFQVHSFNLRSCGPNDIQVKVHFCGLSRADYYHTQGMMESCLTPMVPGHEVVGLVEAVGASVSRFKVGDRVGVGYIVDSCRKCPSCKDQKPQYCSFKCGFRAAYNSKGRDGEVTYGGLATDMVVDESFGIRLPDELLLKEGCPLVTSGTIAFMALKGISKDLGMEDLNLENVSIGVVGFGGVGHLIVKMALAMKAKVTVISHSEHKKEDVQKLGAKFLYLSENDRTTNDEDNSTLQFLIDTCGNAGQVNTYLNFLKTDGTLVICALPGHQVKYDILPTPLIFGRKRVSGTFIGSIKDSEEAIDFAVKSNITANVEVINPQDINTAFNKIINSQVKYRFVVDLMNPLPSDLILKSESIIQHQSSTASKSESQE